MKIPAFDLRFTLALLPFPPAFAAQPSATAALDGMVALPTGAALAQGMSRESVVSAMGTPDHQLSPDVWVYWDFKAKKLPGSEGYDTLVVRFSDDRVTLLRLTHSEVVRTFIHQQKTRARQAKLATR